MPNTTDLRLAVLIDADNAPHTQLTPIMEEIAVHGTPTIKRIYGDWTGPYVTGWKNKLLEHAITPVQQYAYTQGKNATDSAMIIDAMDILYSERVDGFCIVSSDSDFTRLATRLREAGMKVIGIGERKTPAPFIAACDKFTYIEIIRANQPAAKLAVAPRPKASKAAKNIAAPSIEETTKNGKVKKEVAEPTTPTPIVAPAPHLTRSVIDVLAATIEDVADDDGWAFLGKVGHLIMRKQPSFDPRNFGYQSLTKLIQAVDDFEIDFRNHTHESGSKLIYVRIK